MNLSPHHHYFNGYSGEKSAPDQDVFANIIAP